MYIPSTKVSYVIPASFEEKILRVYLRKDFGPKKSEARNAAKLAFRRFLRSANLGSPLPSPPPSRNSVSASTAQYSRISLAERNHVSLAASRASEELGVRLKPADMSAKRARFSEDN